MSPRIVLEFIRQQVIDGGQIPTVDEIGLELGKGGAAAAVALDTLQRAGWLRFDNVQPKPVIPNVRAIDRNSRLDAIGKNSRW